MLAKYGKIKLSLSDGGKDSSATRAVAGKGAKLSGIPPRCSRSRQINAESRRAFILARTDAKTRLPRTKAKEASDRQTEAIGRGSFIFISLALSSQFTPGSVNHFVGIGTYFMSGHAGRQVLDQ